MTWNTGKSTRTTKEQQWLSLRWTLLEFQLIFGELLLPTPSNLTAIETNEQSLNSETQYSPSSVLITRACKCEPEL